MIAANNVVAADMFWREEPFVYRVHDQPDPDRLQQFNEFIHNFGYHVKGDIKDIHPRALQEVLAKVAGTAEERIIDTVLLRSMKKAVYATKNIGHFGLAIEHYTHFTSPIRRYPDLIVHRLLKEIQEKGSFSKKRTEELERKLPIIADQSSLQERRAMEAERDSVKLKKIEYMVDQVGEEFSGIISGITGFGFFVELDNTVEGLVHVKNMDDDYYHYDESVQAMIGERTKNMYRLGDEVRIKVSRVSLEDRELDFQIIED